jgi:hypothetical protein
MVGINFLSFKFFLMEDDMSKRFKAHTLFCGPIMIPNQKFPWADIFKDSRVVVPLQGYATIKAVQKNGKVIGWTEVPDMPR